MRLAVFLALFGLCLAQTELETNCAARANSVYFRGSCYYLSPITALNNPDPKCTEIENRYQGHLAYILDQDIANVLMGITTAYRYIGGKKIGSSWSWYHPDGRTWALLPDHASKVGWDIGQPSGAAIETVLILINGRKHDGDQQYNFYYICQYEDKEVCFKTAEQNKKGSAMAMISTHNNVDVRKCGKLCMGTPVCQSYAHNESTKECLLYTYMAKDMTLEAAIGFKLLEKK